MKIKIRETLFPAVKILVVLISAILIIFIAKYLYQILDNILIIKPSTEVESVSFEVETFKKFAPRLNIEIK